jgi:sugar O-acyltransferase (sialic acid O-acetyltransferase NeuD family)
MKMRNIYIFGTGGFAKEVYFLITEINQVNATFELAGFIDIKPRIDHLIISGKKIKVFDEAIFFDNPSLENDSFAIGIGNPKILNEIKVKYLHKYDFPNLIHPNVIGLFDTIKMGKGNIITAGCIFTLDITIGSFNIFNLTTTVGHDAVICDCNVINPGANISGAVCIGDNNLIGTNSTILQSIKIGNNNMIGAGAMVNKSFENNSVIVGIPAKVIAESK